MTPVVLIAAFLLAAVLGLLVRGLPALAKMVATSSSAFVLIVAIGAMVRTHEASTISGILPGVHVAGLDIPFELAMSRPLASIAFVVAVVVCAVQVYAVWYLHDDERYPIFAATVSLFAGAMLLVVHSGDLVLTLIGWEVMGWCSYLLIGHLSARRSARTAAHKSFLVTVFADVGFVLGVAALITGAGTSATARVVQVWSGTGACATAGATATAGACPTPGSGLRDLAMVLLLIGILGKSAQLPFQDWLPDAMEGPTPASALIHAATMVAAGTIVIAQLFPVLAASTIARWVLGIVTAVTMVTAALVAFGQSDLKRLLAWSTISQVAIMLSALAVAAPGGSPDAGLFHLWSHAIFKALLFLALGWLAAIVGGTSAIALRGAFHHAPPVLVWGMIFGLISLAGVPLFIGGLSKEHVLVAAYQSAVGDGSGPGLLVLCALLLTIVLTALYATRVYLVLTAPLADLDADPAGRHPPASQGARWALAGLSGLTVLGGLVLLSDVFEVTEASLVWSGITLVLIVAGVVAAIVTQGDSDPAVRLLGRRVALFDNGFRVDAGYRALAGPVTRLARVAAYVDKEAIDGYVVGSAWATRLTGTVGERLHRAGRPVGSMALVVAGVLALGVVAVFTWR